MLYKVSAVLLYILCKLLFKLEIRGKEAFPKDGHFILVSNHVSNLDPVVVGVAALPYSVRFIAKEELFENKIFAFVLRNLGVISLKRQRTGIKELRSTLKILKKHSIAMFPQGTRSSNLDKVNPGVGFFYKKSKIPIVAARIYGTDEILPKGAAFLKAGKIKVIFSKVDKFNDSDSSADIALKVAEKIKSL